MSLEERAQVRREVRAARRRLSDRERFVLSHQLSVNLARSGMLLRTRRLAAFWPNDGEVDLSGLFPRLWQAGKKLYLPVIAGSRLWFAPFGPETAMAENRFGIPEPRGRHPAPVPTWALDVVLMPLVAFDGAGNRIGMGGGFYDRTFAYKRHRHSLRRPLLVGTAFGFQHRARLDAQPWDVPLDAVVTEQGFRWLRAARWARAPQSTSP